MKKQTELNRTSLIKFLLNPSSYPHNPKSVKHIQTHISDVFIAPPYVYKVKKPVDFGFLDFTTLKKRRFYCEKEVELNRKFCDIYLGVEKISLSNNRYKFGKGVQIIEYAIKMKRLPEKYFLKNILNRGDLNFDLLNRVIGKMVEYYKTQTMASKISEFGQPERIKVFIYNNIALVRNFIGNTISPVSHEAITFYNDMFFEKNNQLFQNRIKKGLIKDCHGDLHLMNINITQKFICIHDRIEFNDRFRFIDFASDIAFLAMDLDFNGRSDLSDFVVSQVARRMHDKTIFKVIDFYKCYRAYVRGKVESLKSEEREVAQTERSGSLKRAKEYFRLSLKYALFGSKAALVIIFGLIGSGKTTLANSLSRELSCDLISSDTTRKRMLGVAPTVRRYEEFDKGIYSKKITDNVYKEIINRAMELVESGKTVILDASFSKRKYRQILIEEARSLGIPILFIHTKASEKSIKERLIRREEIGKAVSDGRWEIFDRFKIGFEEPTELPRNKHLVLSSDNLPQEVLIDTLRKIIAKRLV